MFRTPDINPNSPEARSYKNILDKAVDTVTKRLKNAAPALLLALAITAGASGCSPDNIEAGLKNASEAYSQPDSASMTNYEETKKMLDGAKEASMNYINSRQQENRDIS